MLYKHMMLAEMRLHITETKIEKVKYEEADKTQHTFLLGLFHAPIWSRAHGQCLERGEKCLDKSFVVCHSRSGPVRVFIATGAG